MARMEKMQALMAVSLFACVSATTASLAQRGTPGAEQQPALELAPAPLPGTELTTDWRASRIIGTTMTNMLNESVGKVEDIVIDTDGKVVAVMVGVGGFLGLGETSVAIGLRHLVITQPDPDHLEVKTSLTRRAIEQAASLDAEDTGDNPPAPQ